MRSVLVLGFVVASLTACGKGDKPPPPTSGAPNAKPESGPGGKPAFTGDPKIEARNLFGTVCVTCHGEDGSGNGAAAANLPVKPRNYTDAAWQASVTDDDLRKIIVGGGQSVGKSGMMPAQPQLKNQPEVLDELVKTIRGFANQ